MTHSGVCSELLLQTLATLHIALLTSSLLITMGGLTILGHGDLFCLNIAIMSHFKLVVSDI